MMGYGLDGGIRVLAEASGFSIFHAILTGTRAYPVSYPVDTWGVNRLVHEAEHAFPSSAEVKKLELYLQFPINHHGVVLN
jgi:hypothetical protein